jgi:alpha-ketoglutarate-dependent taurine dioxygenase
MTAATIELTAVKCTPDELTLSWQNSTYSVYTALWLRDNDPAHRDADTGARLISLLDLPREPRLQSAEPGPSGHITLRWEDGATSIFSLLWLRAYDRSLRTGGRPMRLPWMGQPSAAFAACDYEEWVEKPASRRDWLYYAGRDGLAFLRNVPIEDAAVLGAAAQIGFVREADFGRTFDVRKVAGRRDLAFTGSPYRDPVPGFQLLHCLSAAGRECTFVDGMAAADHLRARDSDAFSTLSQVPIRFHVQDLLAERTMLEIDTEGLFRAIHYDERSIAPLPLKGPMLKKYYAAYRQLAELLREPERLVVHPLQRGDLILFDNTRILHGYSAFSVDSHLQGCYLDADGLYRSLAVLSHPSS